MFIKRQLSAALFVLVTQACISQNSSPDIISSSGGYQSNASGSLSWTIGEPLVETETGPTNFLTQGFQQPSGITISSTDDVINLKQEVIAYPNPSSGLVFIAGSSAKPMQVNLFDLAGQLVYKKDLSAEDNALNLGNLANGVYLLEVFTNTGQLLQTLKLEKIN